VSTKDSELAGPSDPYPSLDLVRAELDVETASLEKRTASVDTKAGVILGFSGVVVALTKDAKSWISVAGQIVAVIAACIAIWAFFPRHGSGVSPLELRNRYLTTPLKDARLVILDTRLVVHGQDEQALKNKANRLRWALIVLAIAIGLIVIGTAITVSKGGNNAPQSPPSGTTSTIPATATSSPTSSPASTRP
jgi:hypothetical protein